MNYISRYGLEYNPFIKNTQDKIVETEEYKQVSFRLNVLLQTKGFGLITGLPGRGKTTALRNWVKTLNPAAYKVVYIALSTLTVSEFYKALARELGIEPSFRKVDNFREIQSAITRYTIEKKVTPIIILDEANYMMSGILNDIKIIFNFEMDSQDRAIVILCGLPTLNNTLRLNTHEPLRQRITMNYTIESLSKEEAMDYIHQMIRGAGSHQTVFDTNALEALVNTANGVPRTINKYCDKCLLVANNMNKNTVDIDVVTEAVTDNEV